MPSCVVRDSVVTDIYALASRLRTEDESEITGLLAKSPRVALRASYRHAILRRTALIDGEIAAMWGLGGAMLSDIGTPWLMTTPLVERVPVTFLKVGRAQLAEMLMHRRFLSNYVLATYRGAVRFLEVLGFVLDPATPMGPQGLPFRRFWMER